MTIPPTRLPISCGRLAVWSLLLVTTLLAGSSPGQSAVSRGDVSVEPFETIRDVVYRRHGDKALRADIYRPLGQGPFAAVLLVHGGAWTSGNKTQLDGIAELLAVSGYAVVAIDYRLAPKHKFPAQIEDCRDALRWMQQNAATYQIDPTRLAGWGYSAGGHLVTLLALTTPGLGAIVAGGAPCDFREIPPDNPLLVHWLGGTRRECPAAYQQASPAQFASADCPPAFFYHGEQDRLVPVAQPRAMTAQLAKLGVAAEMHEVPGAGHVNMLLDRDMAVRAVRFLDRHLRQENLSHAGR